MTPSGEFEEVVGKGEVCGEHAEAKAVGVKKRVIGLAGEPDGRCLLDGHGQDTDFCCDTSTVGQGDRFSAPQFLNEGDLSEHVIVTVLIGVGERAKPLTCQPEEVAMATGPLGKWSIMVRSSTTLRGFFERQR